ncbi:hypothetical protein [Kitasatospora sp. NPDC008115]|uniref:hypothetical protein n=1 Tax=Kitasatospora sp. NPDC008115 TaxID=3364022 RepID=UPI0036E9D020
MMVELHHDGTVTVSADLTHRLDDPPGMVVDTQVPSTVVLEAVAPHRRLPPASCS